MKYRAVIFDLFGTLVENFSQQVVEEMFDSVTTALGADRDKFVQAWKGILAERAVGTFPAGPATIMHVCGKIGLAPDPGAVQKAVDYRIDYFVRNMIPRPDASATIIRLKAKGLKVGLISDCSWEPPMLWKDNPLARHFKEPVFSCEVGMKKPDPRIYELACTRLDVKPGECLYVGDGSSFELTGAEGAGMTPIKIRVPRADGTEAHYIEEDDWEGTTITALSQVLDHIS